MARQPKNEKQRDYTSLPSFYGRAVHSRAFTLLELLVVVSIIGVLCAVILSALPGALVSARRTQCANNLKQIGTATSLYLNDNNGFYPGANLTSWDTEILPYLQIASTNGAAAILRCPADSRPLIVNAANGTFARSYAIVGITNTNGVAGETAGQSRNISQLSPLSTVLLFAEWINRNNYQFGAGYSYIQNLFMPAYHGSYNNYCFADGHVAPLSPANATNYLPEQ